MKKILKFIFRLYLYILKKIFYPKCNIKSRITFFEYILPQKILGLNGSRFISWPVHFTSIVNGYKNISIKEGTAPGRSAHQYIQATNGIILGKDIYMAPGVNIISANHDSKNLGKHIITDSIIIGDNCWLGANCVILPGVHLGNNVVIGAGAIVTKTFLEDNIIIVGNPAKIVKNIK